MSSILKKIIHSLFVRAGYDVRKVANRIQEFPVEASEGEKELIDECLNFSMTNRLRMWALVQAMKYVTVKSIPGHFVECGVWKGGNLALMGRFLDLNGGGRTVYGYDTFEGMSEPTLVDRDLFGNSARDLMRQQMRNESESNIHCYAPLEKVKQNLESTKITSRVILVQGPVEHTLPLGLQVPDEIAVLRLDTDWYESTRIELEHLYPRLAIGGVLIIDDYGHHQGCRKAVDEYFAGQSIWWHYIDYSCRLMIKGRSG